MPTLDARVTLRFEAASVEAAGPALRRLQEVTRQAGFQLVEGVVGPAAPPREKDRGGGTPYSPLVPPNE
jgi:hypothetical protein